MHVAYRPGRRIIGLSKIPWLAGALAGKASAPWVAPRFTPIVRIHGFKPHVGGIPTDVKNCAPLFGDSP